MWVLYIFYFIFISYILFLLGAKIYSPFWFHQPIYHIYELYPRITWKRNPYIKRNYTPRLGIYCLPKQIKTILTDKISNFEKYITLLQGHYLDNTTHLFQINQNVFKNILYPKSFISGFFDTKREDTFYREVLNTETVYGVITSRPVYIYFHFFEKQNSHAHFLDHICTHEKHKEKNISRNLIQTHIYNHKRIDSKFSGVYVFKKEIDVCKAVVPFVSTSNYTFILKQTPIQKLPSHYSIRCLNNKTCIHLWKAIYAELAQSFEISVLPSIQDTFNWLTNERYYIYVSIYVVNKIEHIHGVYIFENTHITWENMNQDNPFMLRLTCSMVFPNQIEKNDLLFFRGFLHSLKRFLLDQKKFGVIEIPNISHNDLILEKWKEKYNMTNETKISYYFYNLVYPNSPVLPHDVVCLL